MLYRSMTSGAKSIQNNWSRYFSNSSTLAQIAFENIPKRSGDIIFDSISAWRETMRENQTNEFEMITYPLGDNTALCPFHPNGIKEIYRLENQGIVEPSSHPVVVALLGKKSLVFVDQKEHTFLRRKLNPFFTFDSMRQRFDLVCDLVDDILETIYTKTESEGEVHLYTEAKSLAFKVAVRVIFGDLVTADDADKLLNYLSIWFEGWKTDLNVDDLDNPDTILGKAMIAKYDFEDLIRQIWRKGIEKYEKGELDENSSFYGFIHSGELNEDEIGEIMLTIVFAGYETTAASMCSLAWNMYKYPKEKELLAENIKDLDQRDFDEVMENEYLDSFIKESMRMQPVVAFINKVINKDQVFNGCPIGKDNFLTIPFAAMNFNRDVYDNPDVFDGQRFIHNAPKRNAFIPFSVGLHKCLGEHLATMELKCIAAALATKCDIKWIDEDRTESPGFIIKCVDVHGRFMPLIRL